MSPLDVFVKPNRLSTISVSLLRRLSLSTRMFISLVFGLRCKLNSELPIAQLRDEESLLLKSFDASVNMAFCSSSTSSNRSNGGNIIAD